MKIYILTRPESSSAKNAEYPQFRKCSFFTQKNGLLELESLFVISRLRDDQQSLDDSDIVSLFNKGDVVFYHDHDPNKELLKLVNIDVTTIPYSSQGKNNTINIESESEYDDNGNNIYVKYYPKFFLKDIGDFELKNQGTTDLINFIGKYIKKQDKLETSLEFLHQCLVSIPDLTQGIDKKFKQTMYVGKDNDGSIGALYDKWVKTPNEENLSKLRDVVLEWAEK